MGGVMIKVGQFLSTRVDVLPDVVTHELAGLQDEVPPVPFDEIRQVIEDEFHTLIEEQFLDFQSIPVAAASLGQVHQATLKIHKPPTPAAPGGNGHLRGQTSSDRRTSAGQQSQQATPALDVVVKVQRPNIEHLIATDLRALRTVGNWLKRYRPIRKRVDVPALLNEFARILYQEIDYLAEGRNAETFATNFASNPFIRVPQVVWSHTTRRVLTLENVLAIKITEYTAISDSGINRAEVASRLLDTYLQQIYIDGFFHADPHPGNLFVEPAPVLQPAAIRNPASPASGDGHHLDQPVPWRLTFVDFGMVGHVPPNLRDGLHNLLIGVATRDSPRVVRAYQEMGILLPDADLEMLEKAGARIFERYWGMNMSELSNLSMRDFREFADEFRDLLYTLPFQIPQDLIFLFRTIGILAGICLGLDPKFNLWAHLVPFAQKLMTEEVTNHRGDWVAELQTMARTWLSIPIKLDFLINKIERGDVSVRSPEITNQVRRVENAIRQVTIAVIFLAFLLGGIQLGLAGRIVFAGILLGGAILSLIWLVWPRQ
jgi:predicted unusual protein kinase regulating ubiquinone biosynthesis (AarF/ABC1/UbiB family)